MKLKPVALGLATGILWGVGLMLVTWWFVLIGSPGSTLSKVGIVYLGYHVSFGGGIIGLIWGFLDGFIGGVILGWLYNKFVRE